MSADTQNTGYQIVSHFGCDTCRQSRCAGHEADMGCFSEEQPGTRDSKGPVRLPLSAEPHLRVSSHDKGQVFANLLPAETESLGEVVSLHSS